MATKTKSKPENIRLERYVQSLKVALSADEIADRADRASQVLADMDCKENELKAIVKHQKSEIDTLGAELRRLSDEVRTKATYRPVECERKFLYDQGKLLETRVDTHEVLLERPLTWGEKQRDLPMGVDKNGEDEDDDENSAATGSTEKAGKDA